MQNHKLYSCNCGTLLHGMDQFHTTSLVNPRRACATRATVVVLCVCLSDCVCVRFVYSVAPLAASNVFCVHNCTSPSNDYAAVACSNNNQAQLHTHVSVPYWSPDIWLGRASVYEISKSTGFHVDFGFQSGFLDFTVDFWISVWISADRFLLVCSWIF